MVEMVNDGRTTYLVNDTADSLVTESAAAAGQIATGQRMTARAMSMAADGTTPIVTVMEMAKEQKNLVTALVTTSGITAATPAAFCSHVSHRSNEQSVADQQMKLGVDVLMGGRRQFFLPATIAGGKREDGRNLVEEAKEAGYAYVETADELQAAEGDWILGLFNMGNLSYEIDRKGTLEPSLAEMTGKTLQILSKSPNGCFAMIVGGRIHPAAQRNDAAATIRDVLAYDEAVGVACDFAWRNPDTLVIVTADHDTAGMALIGHSKVSKEYVGLDCAGIEGCGVSFEAMTADWGGNPSAEMIRQEVLDALHIGLTEAEAQFVADDIVKKSDPNNFTYDYLHSLGFVLRPYFRVGWGSQGHTASPLFLFAAGPGAEAVNGLMHNTEVFTVIRSTLELR